MEETVQLVEDWLSGRNLRQKGGDALKLEGEALTYAVVTFLVRRDDVPSDVVVALAEGYFGRIVADTATH